METILFGQPSTVTQEPIKYELSDGSIIFNGDNLDVLKTLSDNSFDSIVTDPPYGISFMGKKWDYHVPTVELWKECLRVLKPGGYLLSFASPRTYHRIAVRIDDAGFEIRDQLMWVFGQGFPKNHNLGNGLGTALKPAHEPIVMARKPLSEKTVAQNVMRWGTGAINIDNCRIGNENYLPKRPDGRFPANIIFDEEAGKLLDEQSGFSKTTANKNYKHSNTDTLSNTFSNRGTYTPREDKGGASRFFYCSKASKKDRDNGLNGLDENKVNDGRISLIDNPFQRGETLRKNIHPTVKPTELMQYLVRLVTPKNGICADVFFGSGSTGKACIREGFKFIGIEEKTEYFNISISRCEDQLNQNNSIAA